MAVASGYTLAPQAASRDCWQSLLHNDRMPGTSARSISNGGISVVDSLSMHNGPQTDAAVTGYLHPLFAQSVTQRGAPRELVHCGGWILERTIPGSSYLDGMGCYPLFACRDWSLLHRDVAELRDDLVSLSLVTDPFGNYTERDLRECFHDRVVPFKEHYVIDMQKPRDKVVSKHHRETARKALNKLTVEEHPDPPQFLDGWMEIYGHAVNRHRIAPPRQLSREAFALQLAVPGARLLYATHHGELVAAALYFCHGGVAYGHILGCSPLGYDLSALYAIIWTGLDLLADQARWCNLMGVPGLNESGAESIRQHKLGWTQETRTAYFCGHIFNPSKYAELVAAAKPPETSYFPAYRHGEMA